MVPAVTLPSPGSSSSFSDSGARTVHLALLSSSACARETMPPNSRGNNNDMGLSLHAWDLCHVCGFQPDLELPLFFLSSPLIACLMEFKF